MKCILQVAAAIIAVAAQNHTQIQLLEQQQIPFGEKFTKGIEMYVQSKRGKRHPIVEANSGKVDFEDDDCLTLLQRLTNYFITNADIIAYMQFRSGKTYNDYGKYDECVQAPDFNYLLAYINTENKLPIPFSIGLCVPKVCKAVDMNELKPYLIPALNSYLPFVLSSTEGFELTHLTLTSNDIVFDNSQELNVKYTHVTLFNGFFISMMVFYILATVAASIIAHQRFKMRKKKL